MPETCDKCGCTLREEVHGNMVEVECLYCGESDAFDILSTPCYTEVELYQMTGEANA